MKKPQRRQPRPRRHRRAQRSTLGRSDSNTSNTDFQSQTCERCLQINIENLTPSRRMSRTPTFSLGLETEIFREESCSLCQTLRQTFHQQPFVHGATYHLYPIHTRRLHSYRFQVSPKLKGVPETVSLAIISDSLLDRVRKNHLSDLKYAIDFYGYIGPRRNERSPVSFYARKLECTVDDMGAMKDWLDFCDQHHQKSCKMVPDRERTMLPITLLDCKTRSKVEWDGNQPYVTLSYRWGSSSASESEDLTAPLPRTIENAIAASRMMGFRYLWVDRFCIEQSATTDDEKKAKQAQIDQMDLIYGHSSLTIVAAMDGDGPTVGLPGMPSTPRALRCSFTTASGQSYVSVPPEPLQAIKNSTWNGRGWTFQEALLARRYLVFCADQVFFTCGGMTCRDATDVPLEAMHRKNLTRFSAWNINWNDAYNATRLDNRLFKPLRRVQNPHQESFKLIAAYSKRQMSFPSDALNGIAGVFQRIKSIYGPFRHLHAIPVVPDITLGKAASSHTENLITGLCWDIERFAGPNPSQFRRKGFPSWSWTGWLAHISAPSEYDGYVSNTHQLQIAVEVTVSRDQTRTIRWEDYCTELDSTNQTTTLPRLHLTGDFVEVYLSKVGMESAIHDVADSESGWQVVVKRGDGTEFGTGFRCTLGGDERLYEKRRNALQNGLDSFKMSALVMGERFGTVLLPSRHHNPTSVSLILMVVHTRDGRFERLGLAVFHGKVNLIGVPVERRSFILE